MFQAEVMRQAEQRAEKYADAEDPLAQFVYKTIQNRRNREGVAFAEENQANLEPEGIPAPWSDVLECPVCREVARPGVMIKTCESGHFVCNGCLKKITKCPLCRRSDVTYRNLILEKLFEEAMRNVQVKCKNQAYGCCHTETVSNISKHEIACPFRYSVCIRRHTGQVPRCNWSGPFIDLLQHLESGNCTQIVKSERHLERATIRVASFRGAIGDFPETAQSALSDNTSIMRWDPIVFFPRDSLHITNLLVHAFIRRNGRTKTWSISIRAMQPKEACERTIADLLIYSHNPGSPKIAFRAPVVTCEEDEQNEEAIGRTITLTDDSVRLLKDGRILFRYSLVLTHFRNQVDEEVFSRQINLPAEGEEPPANIVHL